MQQRPKCQVKGCNNEAFMMYGNKYVCGSCYYKIYLKNIENKNKEVEDLEI